MIKLSKLLGEKSGISTEEFKSKITKTYIKEIMLECIEELADEGCIEECKVSFNYNMLRRDLSLDEARDIISGETSQKVYECVNELIDFDEIQREPDCEIEEDEMEK